MMTATLKRVERAWLPIADVLRVPQNDLEYDKLVVLPDDLIDEVGEGESHPLASFMDVVGVLIENCERQHVAELS